MVTLVVVYRVARGPTAPRRTSTPRARGFTGPQNGIAIAGDYLSAASFLGIAGAIALYGYDGFLYSIGFLVAWLVALLLVAELLRNTGKFTMGDVLAFRMRQRPVRAAAATSTLAVSLLLPARPDGGRGRPGRAAAPDPGRATGSGQGVVIAVVGVLMIVYVLVGGMKGTTWVQIIKAVLLLVGAAVHDDRGCSAIVGFNLSGLLGQAAAAGGEGGRRGAGAGRAVRHRTPSSTSSRSRSRWCSAPRACRTSSCASTPCRPRRRPAARCVWAIGLIGLFYLFTLVLGYGAAALVGPGHDHAAPGEPELGGPAAGLRSSAAS